MPPFGKLLLGAMYTSIAVAIVATAMLVVSTADMPRKLIVSLGSEEITAVVADTKELREKGLIGRKNLKANEGMLFAFTEPGLHGFWMKDMQLPIDIIWFDENYQIVDVWERALPASYPKVFTPHTPAQFVLEVQAGYFEDHHLKTGNILKIPR